MANMYRITNCPAGCISPLRSWSFFGDFYFDLKRSLIDGSPSRREAGRTGSNHLPVKIVNTGGSSSTELGTGPLQSWVMLSTGRYHIVWNLHDISSVGEEAECQPQGITSHSIASWPVLNDVKLYPFISCHIRLICSLVFTQDFWMETMAGTWQWSARSKGTSRFWFWDHSSHNSNRIPFHTSCASTLSRPTSIKPSSNPVFPVVVQRCVGLGGYPVVGRPLLPSTYLPQLLPALSLTLYWYITCSRFNICRIC